MSSVKSFIAAVVPAVTVAATLSAVFVGSSAHAGAAVGPGELSGDLSYACQIEVGGLNVGRTQVGVTATASYPETASPGDVLPGRTLRVTLSPSELVRQSVRDLLGADTFEGVADDVALDTESAGRTTTLAPGPLTIARAAVPASAGWTIDATGTIPAVTVPEDAREALWLRMPASFDIAGDFTTANGERLASSWACSSAGTRTIGGILLEGATNPTPPTDDPTTVPTSTPTTNPPTDPVSEVPVGPGILARKVDYRCQVNAGDLPLGLHQFTFDVSAPYPETAVPGDVLPARDLTVRWEAPETVREMTALLLRATVADADSDDGKVSITTNGRTTELEPTPMYFQRSNVPQVGNETWVMRGVGTIPAITIPQDATAAVWVGLPASLTVNYLLGNAAGDTFPMKATCAAAGDRLLGGIALDGQTAGTPPVLDLPDLPTPPTPSTPPTSPPTSAPPTAYPTDPPAEPGSAAPVGPGELSRTLPHRCAVVADGLVLGTHDVPVAASATYPETAEPGDTLAARRVGLSLALPELLRQSVTELFDAYESDGFFRSPAWSLTTNGRTTSLGDPQATFPLANVPQMTGFPWTLQGGGTLPAITVPEYATEALWIETPVNFSIVGRLYRADHTSVAWELNCTGPSDRRVGGIALEGGTPQPSPSMTMPTVPTTAPTTPTTAPTMPTTAPTTPATVSPTTAPTSAPVLLAPTVKVGAAALWRSAVFTVGVSTKGAVPTGTVTVRLGDKTVAKNKLFLGVTILTASNLPRGDQTFTITYSGDAKVAAKTVTKVVRIN